VVTANRSVGVHLNTGHGNIPSVFGDLRPSSEIDKDISALVGHTVAEIALRSSDYYGLSEHQLQDSKEHADFDGLAGLRVPRRKDRQHTRINASVQQMYCMQAC